jgi:hypothetical protein
VGSNELPALVERVGGGDGAGGGEVGFVVRIAGRKPVGTWAKAHENT